MLSIASAVESSGGQQSDLWTIPTEYLTADGLYSSAHVLKCYEIGSAPSTLAQDVVTLAEQQGEQAKSPQAVEPEGTAQKMFKQMDTDGSNEILRDEFIAWWPKWQLEEAATLFRQIDTDGDGSVSSDEFAAWWTEREQLLAGRTSPADGLL